MKYFATCVLRFSAGSNKRLLFYPAFVAFIRFFFSALGILCFRFSRASSFVAFFRSWKSQVNIGNDQKTEREMTPKQGIDEPSLHLYPRDGAPWEHALQRA